MTHMIAGVRPSRTLVVKTIRQGHPGLVLKAVDLVKQILLLTNYT